jgi:hypothetical protein
MAFVGLLVGAGCHRAQQSTPAMGYPIDIATAPAQCGDASDAVATAVGNHQVRLEPRDTMQIAELPRRLHEIFQYRAERVLYVRAEPGVSFGDFIELIDAAWPQGAITSLITPQVGRQAEQRNCLAPSCRPPCAKLR